MKDNSETKLEIDLWSMQPSMFYRMQLFVVLSGTHAGLRSVVVICIRVARRLTTQRQTPHTKKQSNKTP